jgi:voltage-gated potassium channel
MSIKKIAVFGYNSMSFELIKNLDLKQHEIVVVDQDESSMATAIDSGITVFATDYHVDANLEKVGIGHHINVLFSFFPEDSENIFLVISARAMDPNLEIISIVNNPDAAEKLRLAGANKIIDPYEISGRKIHQLVKNPDIATVLDHTVFGRHDLNMSEVHVLPGSSLVNTMASELHLEERNNLILIAIVDKEMGKELHFTIGEKDYKLDAGDFLVVLGPSRDIRAFKKEAERVI